ncbi:MAG: hypothetical protein GY769_04840 [bacterium]|nr:hypothetical protein [bacterium]
MASPPAFWRLHRLAPHGELGSTGELPQRARSPRSQGRLDPGRVLQGGSGLTHSVLLTGRPGVGKTTVVRDLARRLAAHRLAGFYTEEIRERGRRVGFRAVTLGGDRSTIAHVDLSGVPGVGKYGVDVPAIDWLADTTLGLLPDVDLYIIDEIGKMECLSRSFVEAVRRLFDTSLWIVATVARSGSGLIAEVKRRPGVILREVTHANRDDLAQKMAPWLEDKLRSPRAPS